MVSAGCTEVWMGRTETSFLTGILDMYRVSISFTDLFPDLFSQIFWQYLYLLYFMFHLNPCRESQQRNQLKWILAEIKELKKILLSWLDKEISEELNKNFYWHNDVHIWGVMWSVYQTSRFLWSEDELPHEGPTNLHTWEGNQGWKKKKSARIYVGAHLLTSQEDVGFLRSGWDLVLLKLQSQERI